MPPTADDVVRQWFREVWDEGREEAIDRLMASDGLVHGLTGPGGPPTDRPVDFTGITIARVQNGRLVEGWNVFDFLTMYQQIGWVQNPVTP